MSTQLPPDLLLPNEHERRQIFHLLKKESSWTAWRRVQTYYKAWVDTVEESVRQADNNGWLEQSGIPYSDYVLILKGYAHCEEGVQRLRMGDKRVFQFNANGKFAMADRPRSHWRLYLWRLEDGENIIDHDHTPNWVAVVKAIEDLSVVWSEFAPRILEEEDLNAPAHAIYGVWFQENLPKMTFPDPLPEVPDPVEHVLVRTGKTLPCSGIWEPVDVPRSKGLSLFKAPPPSGPFPLIGCMNYLHGGSPAPRAKQETEAESLRADVTWRLLWRDDRYEDGTVPEEEAGYVFMEPTTSAEEDTAAPAPTYGQRHAMSGEVVPESGRWLVIDDLNAAADFEAGQVLPLHQGRKVQWVLADK